MTREPSFEIDAPTDATPGDSLLVGMVDPGMAGITATDYLVSHIETEQLGHVRARNLPVITPFENGIPRNPMRLYTATDANLSILVSEVALPVTVADPFVNALNDWTAASDIRDVTALHSGPFPHGEAEHVVFQVSTDAYRKRHFADSDVPPLSGGFFDGVLGELFARGINQGPPMGTLVTPSHPPGPDFDASLRLLDAVEDVFDLSIDTGELERRSTQMKQHYQELAERVETLREQDGRRYPEDRMFM